MLTPRRIELKAGHPAGVGALLVGGMEIPPTTHTHTVKLVIRTLKSLVLAKPPLLGSWSKYTIPPAEYN